jgi:hypothetical protein
MRIMNLPYECAEGICRNTDGESWLPFITATIIASIVLACYLAVVRDED